MRGEIESVGFSVSSVSDAANQVVTKGKYELFRFTSCSCAKFRVSGRFGRHDEARVAGELWLCFVLSLLSFSSFFQGSHQGENEDTMVSNAGPKKKRKSFESAAEKKFFESLQKYFVSQGFIDLAQTRHIQMAKQIQIWSQVMGAIECPFSEQRVVEVAGLFQKRLSQARQAFSSSALAILRGNFSSLPSKEQLSKV